MKFLTFATIALVLAITFSTCLGRHKKTRRLRNKRTKGCNKFYSKNLPESEKVTIVVAHNVYRNLIAQGQAKGAAKLSPAKNMNQIYWNEDLAKMAQDWADRCDFRMSPTSHRVYKNYTLGENIYTHASREALAVNNFKWKAAIRRWYSEIESISDENIFPYVRDKYTRHFAQVAWAETQQVGCGYAFYEEGGWNRQLYVCFYAPGGNRSGNAIYEQGKPCSNCAEGTMCSQEYSGLCCIQGKCSKNDWMLQKDPQ